MNNSTPFDWRKYLPVHPAADLFPLLPPDELKALADDIKANGIRTQIVFDEDGKLLDGRNRLDALALLGLLGVADDGRLCANSEPMNWRIEKGDPYAIVLSLNVRRRHLTAEQRREVIAKLLKAKPEQSNRQIANQVKADDKTVATVRRELESTAEIPQLEKTIGLDRKARKAKPKKKGEASAKRRKAEYGASDEPDAKEINAICRAAYGAMGKAEDLINAGVSLDEDARDALSNALYSCGEELMRLAQTIGRIEPEFAAANFEDEESGEESDDPDPCGFVVAVIKNATDKANIARRNLQEDFAESDRAEIAEAIDALIRKWESLKRKVGVAFAAGRTPAKRNPATLEREPG